MKKVLLCLGLVVAICFAQAQVYAMERITKNEDNHVVALYSGSVYRGARYYYSSLMYNEAALKRVADAINGGTSRRNVEHEFFLAKEEIIATINAAKGEADSLLKKDVLSLVDIQINRYGCMVDGYNGDTHAYTVGGEYYDIFYRRLADFRYKYNL